MSLVRMQPAEVAASMDAPSKFAQRTNRGFADATCNLVTAVMLPLEPNRYCNGTEGAPTVPVGNSPRRPRQIKGHAEACRNCRFSIFCWVSSREARLVETAILPRFH